MNNGHSTVVSSEEQAVGGPVQYTVQRSRAVIGPGAEQEWEDLLLVLLRSRARALLQATPAWPPPASSSR